MQVHVHDDRPALGQAAATEAAAALRAAVAAKGVATCVVATGASQFDTLAADASVPWEKITVFHLDEYVGIPDTHPASFRKYIRERFMAPLSRKPAAFHEIDGSGDPHAECRRLAGLVPAGNFDVSLVGIGENAHLAFNDPPADFGATAPYLVVDLDEACRRQQVGEGWFAGMDDVPTQAISMAIRRIMASDLIVCSVPDARKAEAVRGVVQGAVTPQVPASILREHARCSLHLDKAAAGLL